MKNMRKNISKTPVTVSLANLLKELLLIIQVNKLAEKLITDN